ncbi:hypothetical protein HNP12_000212 [Aeromonas hydrophila]|uniref:hypothetical protein n=1 Tax=Aeromonas hydrophila TaxID=644 RepID=UPI0021683F82|nr:hypothetical protein [Aeromonas hydrophila]MCS3766173.1 hypothetical protein [Aeromonas hydrophila]
MDMPPAEYELLSGYIRKNKYSDPYMALEIRRLDATQRKLSQNKVPDDFFDDIFCTEVPARLLTKEEYLAQRRAASRAKLTKEQFYKLNQNINREEQETPKKKTRKKKAE